MIAKTIGYLLCCLLLAGSMFAQPVLHWSRGYAANDEDQWLGRPPQLKRVTCYDLAGRTVSQGTQKDGQYFPLQFWKYDAQGHEILTWTIDITGKTLNAVRKTYNAQGQVAQEYYGTDTLHLKLAKEYTYQKGRLVQTKSVGEFANYQRLHFWKYESDPKRITETACYDSLGQNCTVVSVTTWDPENQYWIKTFGDLQYNGGKYICLDSTCEKILQYESHTEGRKLFQRTTRTFDENGHPLHAETLDSVNGCRHFQDYKYDRWGNLLEDRWELKRFGTGRLNQKQILDSEGRCVAVYGYNNVGIENLAMRKRYDAEGHLVEEWEYAGSPEVYRHRTWRYNAAKQCVAIEDSSTNMTQAILRYDGQGRLRYKREIRTVTAETGMLKESKAQFIWTDGTKQTGQKKPPSKPVNPPPTKPEIIGHDTTEYVYEYDAFDSLATVHAIGFHQPLPRDLHGAMMPDFSAQVGSRAWAQSPYFQADTLVSRQDGDTLFLHLQDKYPQQNQMGRSQVRKVWLFRGVPIQVEEYDHSGRQLIFWRDADYAHAARIPARDAGPSVVGKREPHHTLRVLNHVFRTEQKGDTIFREETFAPGGNLYGYRSGYVNGRLVSQQHTQGFQRTFTYGKAGQLVRATSGSPNHQDHTEYKYDAQGRLVGERTFGSSGSTITGTQYVYPDSRTKLIYNEQANHIVKMEFQLEYWE